MKDHYLQAIDRDLPLGIIPKIKIIYRILAQFQSKKFEFEKDEFKKYISIIQLFQKWVIWMKNHFLPQCTTDSKRKKIRIIKGFVSICFVEIDRYKVNSHVKIIEMTKVPFIIKD